MALPGVFKIDCNELVNEPCEPVLFVLLSEAAVPVIVPGTGMYCTGWPVGLANTGIPPYNSKTGLKMQIKVVMLSELDLH